MNGVSHFDVFYVNPFIDCVKQGKKNPMMIRFVADEMILKITLLVCDPMVISNALVSCVIGFEKRFTLVNNFHYHQRNFLH
jgi:hypothetical protein